MAGRAQPILRTLPVFLPISDFCHDDFPAVAYLDILFGKPFGAFVEAIQFIADMMNSSWASGTPPPGTTTAFC
jgi:hypothetical protein